MLPKVRKEMVRRAEAALVDLEKEISLFGVEADKGRLATVALGLRALITANNDLTMELERLLSLYERTGNWKQLVVWLKKVVAEAKAAL